MFREHNNKQYSLIAEGDFSNVLVKKPRFKQTSIFYGTKEDSLNRKEFKSGSNDFFFIHGRDCPIINGYLSEIDNQPRIEIKTNAMSKKQWEELKIYVDSLFL